MASDMHMASDTRPEPATEPTRAERLGGYNYTKTPRCYLVGAGSRGAGYCGMALEDFGCALFVTAVAEPNDTRREVFAKNHVLPDSRTFKDWRDLLRHDPRDADFVLIATQDQDHAEPAIAFLEAGYHVLVEKPMATTRADCERVRDAAHRAGRMLGVCHVLRYTPYTKMIKSLIDSDKIGSVRSINLVEPVGNTHFAHSYVRGNWRNSETSSPILMAKCCHDIDWLLHVTGASLKSVVCVGQQLEFSRAHKPPQAGDATRCVDCAYSQECPYDATRFYVGNAKDYGMDNETPQPPKRLLKALVDGPSMLADIEDAVRDGPYGQCVYECDNNQPDCVTAIFTLVTAAGQEIQVTFEMRALTAAICKREVTICGTKGEIRGDMTQIGLAEFKGADAAMGRTMIEPRSLTEEDTLVSGHWGADWYMMNAFCAAVSLEDPSLIAQVDESVASHMAVFDAEEARVGH